ncbi:MAG: hypothetical protein NCW75_05525 [Phycisphaera sp.]|nr:MAG: hypothetical protein NCW75_05525 [Phycisphaera sp.]
MTTPAVKLRQFLGGPETLTLTVGQDGLELLIPGEETISGGICPVVPSLVQAVDLNEPTAFSRVRSGQLKTQRLATKRRGGLDVTWTVDETDRDTLVAFFDDDVGQHLRPFQFTPDIDGELVSVRPLSPPQFTWATQTGHTITCRCEEMF